ncbi:hypothetical protein B0I35DRAFT_484602 [Stachybotrys elegans]|uniref:Carrier domain-containing protein n=1 Tax=Stachybotrys elegans TaxID=80388 RepID=A0A8K0WLB8_9HYPO|nr:hypothetical protein B0I35DRAFT_484602 [Stachybotrys elegans]
MDAAVIGLSFRLPQGIVDETSLWEALQGGKNLSTEWPANRATIESFYGGPKNTVNKLPTPKGHFLHGDPASFDAPFFSITSQEAEAIDPQQRWALETAYHAFENAGLSLDSIRGSRTSVYVGSMSDDYTRLLAKDADTMPRMAISGTSPSILANRISWFFNLTGPSMHVDSACSSSLTALDLACQSLLNRNASQALVIGSSLMLSPESSLLLSNMNFLSPDGVCHTFDKCANGYARGEGIVALLIKPASAAMQDGDMIRAVIRAIGSNQDGRTPGLTQPSVEAQARLIREVYNKAGLTLESTGYIEAHGTGTVVGDPLEMAAIHRTFGAKRSLDRPLYVGSIKSNIGHLEGGSGLAGVIKSILILEKGIIPPNALFETLNPALSYEDNNIVVPSNGIDWPGNGPRRVSVNSFGFGGSNAHAILDDAAHYLQARGLPAPDRQWIHRPAQLTNGLRQKETNGTHNHVSVAESRLFLLIFSANDKNAILRLGERYGRYVDAIAPPLDQNLADLAYTLAAKRSLMGWRTFAILASSENVPRLSGALSQPVRVTDRLRMAMVFTGQGAQYVNMGLELIAYPAFDKALREAHVALMELGCKWSLLDAMKDAANINCPEYSQVLCTALQMALVLLLRSFGIRPEAVVGHSSGEIAAAFATGGLSFRSALKVAFHRGRLAQYLKSTLTQPEAMVSVNLPETLVKGYLSDKLPAFVDSLHISCINSPLNCTISGKGESVDALIAQLEADHIFASKMNTGLAYHSPTMEGMASKYREELQFLTSDSSQQDSIPMISSVTGRTVSWEELTEGQYWVDNLVSPVRFNDALRTLLAQTSSAALTDIVEVGPHSALRRPISDAVRAYVSDNQGPRYHAVLNRNMPPVKSIMSMAGRLFIAGFPISILEVNRQAAATRGKPLRFLTDLPAYPFDHSRRYWKESRLARDYRLRAPVPPDSLGIPANDWNPLEPRWRNHLSVEAMPWIGDHAINGAVLYPGTGMLVMAIEAVKQTAPNRQLLGFHIKEAHFLNPMLIDNSEATESVIQLRRVENTFDKDATWSDITIYSYHKARWTKCFRAIIQVQYDDFESQMDGGLEWKTTLSKVEDEYHDSVQACSKVIDAAAFYAHCQDHGFQYGDNFRLLHDIAWNGHDKAVARIALPPAHCQTASFVHPATLDAAFHVSLTQVSKGLSKPMATMVPHQLFDTWVSAQAWKRSPCAPMRLASFLREAGSSSASATVYTMSDEGKPLCIMGKLMITSLSTEMVEATARERLIHDIEWKPQLSLQSPRQITDLCQSAAPERDDSDMVRFYGDLGASLAKAVSNVLNKLTRAEMAKCPSHLQSLAAALAVQVARYQEQGLLEDHQAEEFLLRAEEEKPGWRIFPAVVRNLEAIFRGDVDALDLTYTDGLADAFYRSVFDHCCDDRFKRYLELLCHENPALRILEIGAGTGGMTRHVLSALHHVERRSGTTTYNEFMYTDISPSFFANAQEEFDGARITFQTFDVELDPVQQGLEVASYDLILAGGVLHATKNLSITMANVHKLLKPGGQLLMVEMISPESIHANVGFGVLPGWWLSQESHRELSPIITDDRWDQMLKDTGFSGTDLILRDYESDACHFSSVIASSAIKTNPKKSMEGRMIVIVRDTEQDLFGKEVAQILRISVSAIIVTLIEWEKLELQPGDVVVCLVEMSSPFLANISKGDFGTLQSMLQCVQNLVWVTCTSQFDDNYPHYATVTGLLRTLRMEGIEKRIISLAVESDDNTTSETISGYIHRVLEAGVQSNPEVEFVVRNGYLSTARLVESSVVDDAIQGMASAEPRHEPLGSDPPTKLSVGTPGMLDTLRFVEDESYSDRLGPDELEVEAQAWAVSFRDVLVALGRVPGDDLGWDYAGIVTKTGANCAFQPGDRVGLGHPGSMRTRVRTSSKRVFRMPDDMTYEEAVSFINPACTAYHSLINVARLEKGESILIHSAAGATGQMATWIAKHRGAAIFATVGNEQKRQFLIDRFGIPASHVFSSRNTSFAQAVKRLTNGSGVHVVLNSLAGDSLRASWDCIAPYGRFIEIGKADIMSNSALPMSNFQRNVTFAAVDLHHLALTKLDLMSEIMTQVLDLVKNKVIDFPFPRESFPASKIEAGFRAMQSGNNIGRIIIRVDPAEAVPKCIRLRSEWTFNSESSYLIVGGLGGIGQAICKWMASKGARHLILLSRSGIRSQAASDTVKDLELRGVKASVVVCDASSLQDLKTALDSCQRTVPPIKGCINAAMALHDSIFEKMDYAQWVGTIHSKVDSAWNLHQLFPKGLDFFILLSSLSGLYGSISLSNYAASCTFQDALAHSRNLNGQKSISLDIGWMRTIGIIAETEVYQRNRVKARDMRPIENDEFLALMDWCCDPNRTFTTEKQGSKGQILIGATTPAFFLSRGETPIPQVRSRIFSSLTGNLEASSRPKGNIVDRHVELFAQAKEPAERARIVAAALAEKLARALSVATDYVSTDKTLAECGVDSLMAIELRNWFIRDFKAKLAIFEMMGSTPISLIGEIVTNRSTVVQI